MAAAAAQAGPKTVQCHGPFLRAGLSIPSIVRRQGLIDVQGTALQLMALAQQQITEEAH